ncbi:hypothetical protein LCGC14_1429620 [marine sediment metagenome]|uniref:Uncharacterized protein n=1 Tax=marine sediment metagenome TaxID=412755 RepID=A0A0F9M4H0_9ZZZZ
MRSIEKTIIILAVIAFVIAVGSGILDVFIQDFEEGVDVLLELGEHSTQALVALTALVAAVLTLTNSARGRKKRGK